MSTPLAVDLSEAGGADISNAVAFLSNSVSEDYAEQFTKTVAATLGVLCRRVADEIADGGRPYDPIHEAASLRYSRPVYREKVETSRSRARRSSSGLWYIFYTLEDRTSLGYADTLVVIAVRHSAAAPFSIQSQHMANDESE